MYNKKAMQEAEMQRRISDAVNYVLFYKGMQDANGRIIEKDGYKTTLEEKKNDAANIFGDTYEEYMRIWEAVKEL